MAWGAVLVQEDIDSTRVATFVRALGRLQWILILRNRDCGFFAHLENPLERVAVEMRQALVEDVTTWRVDEKDAARVKP